MKRERENCSSYNDKADSKGDARKLRSLACSQAAATALTTGYNFAQDNITYLWNVPTDPGCQAKKVIKKLLEQAVTFFNNEIKSKQLPYIIK